MQTLTLGKNRYVILPEKEFKRLQKKAGEAVRPDFADEALRDLNAYKKTGKARDWREVKKELGL